MLWNMKWSREEKNGERLGIRCDLTLVEIEWKDKNF